MLEGVYYNASLAADVTPLSLTDARASGQEPFDFVCSQLLATSRVAPQYDYVLVDEAQDFPTSFFRLCFALTKGPSEDRNVVWAYDELQTIMNVAMRQPRDLFGTDDLGTPLIDLRRSEERIRFGVNDIVLHKCYRNPREILVTAHAIGFGIYSDTTVQMLENKAHWEDLGYTVESGECIPGQPTSILRPEENSPLSISRRQTAPELIECYTAANLTDEIDWAVRSVYGLLQDGLRPDDIMIIALDDRNARGYFSSISSRLVTTGVKVNNVLADPYSRPRFFVENHVTLSTVYRAKGNEAPVVLCIGIDALYDTRQLLVTRNKLFTAFTRAKAWLKVSGVGKGAEALFREVQAALSHLPRMVFTYPDPSQLVILQRDLTDRAAKLQRLRDQLSHDFDSLDLSDEERDVLMSNLLKRK
jgi:superfamily I DNA and RNA helicase